MSLLPNKIKDKFGEARSNTRIKNMQNNVITIFFQNLGSSSHK